MILPDDQRYLHAIIEHWASVDPNKTALIFTEGSQYTRGELWDLTLRAAGAAQEAGITVGDRIMIMLDNRFEFIESFLGAVAVGGVPVTPHAAYRGQLLAGMLTSMLPKVIVTQESLVENVLSALPLTEFSGVLAVADDADLESIAKQAGDQVRVVSYADWVNHEPTANLPTLTPIDTALLMYTSGTTGPSKGNIYPHKALFHMLDIDLERLEYNEGDISYACTPLFHGLALVSLLLATLYAGGTCVVAPRFSVSGFWNDMRRWNITKTMMLGQMTSMLLSQPAGADDDKHNIDTIWCAPLPSEYEEFERRFGVRLDSGYGLSDIGWIMWMPRDSRNPASCGKPLPDVEVILADDFDAPVPTGQAGELLVRPRGAYDNPQGYFGMPAATAELLRNAWYHTGDLFRCDEDGWYYFVDRKKDYIRCRGENISSLEIEQVLLTSPGVREAAAFGVRSTLGEEDVKVALILHEGVTLEEIGEYAEAHLPYFAVPRYYEAVEELPKTPSQKVIKMTLRQAGLTPQTWDRGRVRRVKTARPPLDATVVS